MQTTRHAIVGVLLIGSASLGNALFAQIRAEQQRLIPIVVTGKAPAAIKAGDPIPLEVTVKNGFGHEISFRSFTSKPNVANLELQSLSVISIRREGEDRDLVMQLPEIDDEALRVAAPSLVSIPPTQSGSLQTDLTKWIIRGGWQPGRYQVSVRIHEIRVDRFSSVTVDSEPITFVVRKRP